jgi:hypothetical protein
MTKQNKKKWEQQKQKRTEIIVHHGHLRGGRP